MQNKLKSILSGAGFYTTLVVCLLVVGVSGYFLLFDKEENASSPPEEVPPQTEVTASAPELEAPEEPAVVETISPAPVREEAPPMPEVEVDDTPVMAEPPHLVVTPLDGRVLTAFSVDELVYNETLADWRTHDGVDISAETGTAVLAACAGTVASVVDDPLMGTTVTISHADGYQTTYANLQSDPPVEAGDAVSAGQAVGTVGTTAAAESAQGPHLHFSVTKDGDAVDPDAFLNR